MHPFIEIHSAAALPPSPCTADLTQSDWMKWQGGTYFCRWACGHSRQPVCLWLADRWYFWILAARSCRHSWTARWSPLCEETREEETCHEKQHLWRGIDCWEPSMLLRTITTHRIWSVFRTVVSTTTTSLHSSVLLYVLIVCVFSFGA